jgi:hypothetical protein
MLLLLLLLLLPLPLPPLRLLASVATKSWKRFARPGK